MTTTSYLTILSSNYLPKALALDESLRKHHPDAQLSVVFIDALTTDGAPKLEFAESLGLDFLGLTERELLDLATAYDLVEFATAIKPLALKALLGRTEHAFYLDPDTYVMTPMVELGPELDRSEGGILLTPHFLWPAPADGELTEGHMLTFGVFNLGFCGVDRRALPMLDWWWGHLKVECLYDPLAGLFVDQKWMDIGSVLFAAGVLRHPGYNIGVANLFERPVGRDADGIYAGTPEFPVRLFHFHAFNAKTPDVLTTRIDMGIDARSDADAVRDLCHEYAEIVLRHEKALPAPRAYPFASDRTGERLGRQLRRAWRRDRDAGIAVPSPFVAAEAEAFAQWRRRAWKGMANVALSDSAKSARLVLPEEYDKMRAKFPRVINGLRSRFAGGSGIWGSGRH